MQARSTEKTCSSSSLPPIPAGLFSAPTTRNEITLIQRSVLDVAQRSRPARGRAHVTVQQRRGLACAILSLIRWAMTYCQVRGRAASLSPKSRPKIPLPAQSALCLPRNLLTTAHTVRKNAKVSQWQMRAIRWPRRRRNRLLSICLRFLTPGNAPPPGACLALLCTVLGPNSASLSHSLSLALRISLSSVPLI